MELRSKAPLLPMRIFRLRTLTGANVTSFLVGTALFSQFFLGTLYMQQVLHYSAMKTGVAYLPLTLTIIACSPESRRASSRRVRRPPRAPGRTRARHRSTPPAARSCRQTASTSSTSFPRLRASSAPRPGLHLHPADDRGADGSPVSPTPGVASGLFNTTQQIGGAIGLAAASTIAITFTSRYVDSPPPAVSAVSAAGPDLRLPDHLLRARGRGRAGRRAVGRADRATGRPSPRWLSLWS